MATGEVGPLVIRCAERQDVEAIDAVLVEARRDAYVGRLSDAQLRLGAAGRREVERGIDAGQQDEAVLVAEVGGVVVGFVHGGPSGDVPGSGEVYAIYVDPKHWGRGLGRALMTRILASLRNWGFEQAILWVREPNQRARRFYEAGGWIRDGATKHTRVGAGDSDCTVGVEISELRFALNLR